MKHLGCLLLLALAGCPKAQTSSATTAPAVTTAPFADNMADAPTHSMPNEIVGKPACNAASYLRVDAKGAPFTVEVKVDAGCVMVASTNEAGAAIGDSLEVCADKPEAPHAISVPAEQGRPFVTVSETGACGGNTVTLLVK